MYKRICDKCKKDIQNNKYWEIYKIHYNTKNEIDTNQLNWHLCENCYKDIQNFVILNQPYIIMGGN